MFASLFRRIVSSFIDLCLILVVVYGIFAIGGQTILQNRIDNFDIIYADYNDIVDAYNEDLATLQTKYDAAIELANDDKDLELAALINYNTNRDIINEQNTIDINPYNLPLTQYFSEIIYFFVIGFVVLLTVMTMVTSGKTLGRIVLKVKVKMENSEGEYIKPSLIQVFVHDIFLKYFLVVLIFVFNMYYGIMFMLFALLVDVLLITFTKKRSTVRDFVTRIRVLKDTRGY